MSLAIALVLLLVVLAVANFSTEWIPIEVFSLLVMVCLVVSGILPPRDTFMGFANSAVIMIAGVMILTGGVIHNGVADVIARKIKEFSRGSEHRTAALLLGAVNGVSSVINNVAATAMFIPVAEGMARRFGTNRARYLIPIAFASMTGGMCTLIGTSTNVAASGAMEQLGLDPLGFFELTPVGLVVAILGMPYLTYAAPRLLRAEVGAEAFRIREFLFELFVREGSPLTGKTIAEADLGRRYGVNVLAIVRGRDRILSPGGDEPLRADDLLIVEGPASAISPLQAAPGLEVKSLPAQEPVLASGAVRMLEATVSYNSPFTGRTLHELNFRSQYGLSVLAIHRREELVVEKVGKIPLRAGDVLLIFGSTERFRLLAQEPSMLLLESLVLPAYNPGKALVASSIFGLAIAASATGWLDSPTAFLAGGALVLALRCLRPDEAGSYVNIRFLVMLAGMAALGTAMERSGAAEFLASAVVGIVGPGSPLALLAVFFALTVVLTQPLSNAAAALLVLPIATRAAVSAGADPRPFAVGVTIAASCSFITPFEPACLLVYGTGHYRFNDFARVGLLLTLVAFAASLVLIPALWPL
jgi:di/tricarboxylate transporter